MTATDQELTEKKMRLLEQDYTSQCPDCGAVVFEWWDACRECTAPDTEQTTLTDGGIGGEADTDG